MTIVASLLIALPARSEDDVKAARDQFVRGAQLVKEADWAGALAAFEESAKLRPHPVTTFNIGACLRSMGQYTRARRAFATALEENGRTPGADLSPALTDETKRYVAELDRLVANLELTIVPEEAQIAIDGRPLDAGANGTVVAGILPPGPGKPAPKGKFRVVVDPGTHVITISRAGFADAVSRETLAPGASVEKTLVLDRLPAQLHIVSNVTRAQVLVDGADVGLAPVDINRPAGKYKVTVKKGGFLPFETNASADPGQNVNVTATLREDKPTLTQRWWFWTGVGVLVVGAATTTYFLTRPDPERPAVDGGGLNWAVRHP
jgi:hypothetical protein